MALTEAQIIKALEKHGGFVTRAAKALKVTPQAIYKRIDNNQKISDAVEAIRDGNLDLAESKLIQRIKAGDMDAIKYFLNHQGKKRGYVDVKKHEFGNIDGKPFEFVFKAVNASKHTKDS